MQPATATPGSPARSSCCEREREREAHEERERDRNGAGRSRASPVEDRGEQNDERTVVSGQNLGGMTISGGQGLPLSLSLEDRDLWTKFQCLTNEMIVTKNGR